MMPGNTNAVKNPNGYCAVNATGVKLPDEWAAIAGMQHIAYSE